MYKDNDRKFVAVLNRNIELPKLMNALAHCSGGGAALFGPHLLEIQPYIDGSGGKHRGISRFPWIILQSKNSTQLQSLRAKAMASGIDVTSFVHTMIGSSAEQQLENTRITHESELTYFAVCLFGNTVLIDPLTKKFSIFGPRTDSAPTFG